MKMLRVDVVTLRRERESEDLGQNILFPGRRKWDDPREGSEMLAWPSGLGI